MVLNGRRSRLNTHGHKNSYYNPTSSGFVPTVHPDAGLYKPLSSLPIHPGNAAIVILTIELSNDGRIVQVIAPVSYAARLVWGIASCCEKLASVNCEFNRRSPTRREAQMERPTGYQPVRYREVVLKIDHFIRDAVLTHQPAIGEDSFACSLLVNKDVESLSLELQWREENKSATWRSLMFPKAPTAVAKAGHARKGLCLSFDLDLTRIVA